MLSVDRIESGYAVCYDNEQKTVIPLSDIIGKVCEGDILVKSGNKYRIDAEATKRRKKEIIRMQNDLWD